VVSRPRCTLIITTYEWPEALELTLKSVARQSVVPDEVIVADDGSGPETARVVERWRGQIAAA
jgi:glycosyltransferase involved in cell wall biosynthesis